MHIRSLNGKSVCILGFGKEGQAMLKALERYAPDATITIADKDKHAFNSLQTTNYKLQTGPGYLENLPLFEVIIKSPGIPPSKELEAVRGKLTSATQIFFDSIQGSGATVIGVTGSKGKSTTASLLYDILRAAKKDTYLIGNIGKPAIEFIAKAMQGTIFVMELSSYQLMDLTVSPQIAVITAFFPEHVDYHQSLKNYLEAKKRIARFQTEDGVVFYNTLMPEAKEIAHESAGKKIPFGAVDAPIAVEETSLLGNHNLSNIAAAWKVAEHLGIPREIAVAAIKSFRGLPHRLQSLGTHSGIEWVDDAISTTPESAIAALDALGDRVATLILGGQDRGSDFSALAKRIAVSSIEHLILIGETGSRIGDALKAASVSAKQHAARDMAQIVSIAKQVTPNGRICLLSTASPSYDMFKNFEEKGEEFAEHIGRVSPQ